MNSPGLGLNSVKWRVETESREDQQECGSTQSNSHTEVH